MKCIEMPSKRSETYAEKLLVVSKLKTTPRFGKLQDSFEVLFCAEPFSFRDLLVDV